MHALTTMDVAILAGGLGTRLQSVVSDRPKALAPIGDKPFLVYLLDQLSTSGISKVILCTGHRGDQIEQTLGENHGDLHLEYSREMYPLGTGGALANAASRFSAKTILILNGDTYCDVDFEAMLRFHHIRKAQATVLLSHVPDVSRFGEVHLDKNGRILRFEEKRATGSSGWVNAGIYLLEKGVIDAIPAATFVSLEKEVFPTLIGQDFFAYQGTSEFIDIGTAESYAASGRFLKSVVP